MKLEQGTKALIAGAFLTTGTFAVAQQTVDLQILTTADIHGYMSGYDFLLEKQTDSMGLRNLLENIKNARENNPNAVLVDAGDTFFGSPLGDSLAWAPYEETPYNAMACSFDKLGYDAIAPGNHEFDYGLPTLENITRHFQLPVIASNIYSASDDQPAFKPYELKSYNFTDNKGQTVELTIGYIGLVPPMTMEDNASHLDGKIYFTDMIEASEKWIPELKKQGADLVIAVAHSGINTAEYTVNMEDVVYHLADVEGIDAIAAGHSHQAFPSARYANIEGIDIEKGLIKGVPVVQPGKWANNLGEINLQLTNNKGEWAVSGASSRTTAAQAPSSDNKKADILDSCLAEAKAYTERYMAEFVGESPVELSNHYGLIKPDAVLAAISTSYIDFIKPFVDDSARLVAAVAPAVHRMDPAFYVRLPKGDMTTRDINKITYSTTLMAVEVTGKDLRNWLEMTASAYVETDSNALIREDNLTFFSYAFNGVDYDINLSRPVQRNQFGALVNAEGGRIENLTWEGQPVKDDDEFVLISNVQTRYLNELQANGNRFIEIGSPNPRDIFNDFIASNPTSEQIRQPSWSLTADTEQEFIFETRYDADTLKAFKQSGMYQVKNEVIEGDKVTLTLSIGS